MFKHSATARGGRVVRYRDVRGEGQERLILRRVCRGLGLGPAAYNTGGSPRRPASAQGYWPACRSAGSTRIDSTGEPSSLAGEPEWGICLNVTCVQGENGKSISIIDSAQSTKAHDADTDSDLARSPDGKHPSARYATPTMILRSATRRSTSGHVVAHSGPRDSE